CIVIIVTAPPDLHLCILNKVLKSSLALGIGDKCLKTRLRQIHDDNLEREIRHTQLMTLLLKSEKCQDVIRMGPEAFRQLCQKLRGTSRVKDSTRSTAEEQVTKFLHIIGHNVKIRTMSFFFHRSGETTNRHFHNVLRLHWSLDGTHSHVKLLKLEAPRFAKEKITPHKIWERIASDSRILKDALSREYPLRIPK
ncbi:hypothetical protein HN51_037101, partial [Arachis hypogaea]